MKMYLLWEPMKEFTHPQGEMEVCALSCGHSTDTPISGVFFFPPLCALSVFTPYLLGRIGGWGGVV